MLISSPELVQPLREVFDAIWENRYLDDTIEALIQLAIKDKENLLTMGAIVCSPSPNDD